MGVTQKLAAELWGAYCDVCPDKVPTVLFQLAKISDIISGEDPHAALQARMRHYTTLLVPADLFEATALMSRETGRPRRREIVQLEGVILANVTATGQWK